MLLCVQEEQQVAQNAVLTHSRRHVNQVTPTAMDHNVLRQIRKKMGLKTQHRTSNAHRAVRELTDTITSLPKMYVLLEVERMPAVIVKPRLSLVPPRMTLVDTK